MGRLRFLFGNAWDRDILAYHDVVVFPGNLPTIFQRGSFIPFMENIGYGKTFSFLSSSQIGDIRIMPNKENDYLLFFCPFFENNSSISRVVDIYQEVLKLLVQNEYREVLVAVSDFTIYGFPACFIGQYLYEMTSKFVSDTSLTVDFVISNREDRKYYG